MRNRQAPRAIARQASPVPVLAIASALVLGGILFAAEAHAATGDTSTSSMSSDQMSSGQMSSGQMSSGHVQMNSQDRQFVEKAGPANMAEVQMGKLAAEKGTTPAIQEFGRWMQSAHGGAYKELDVLADSMHLQGPSSTLTSQQKQEYTKLKGLSGTQFDQEYLQLQAQAHHQAIALYHQEATQGENKWLTTYAKVLEPALHQHLAEVEDLQADMKGKQ